MIEVSITKEQIERAKNLYGFYNIPNSFTKGESQIYGALGEIIFADYYNLNKSSHIGDKDYDFLYRNKKIEIKTKKTSKRPLPYYLCSIPINSLFQKCDEYVFVRILKDMTKGWICGWITKKNFFNMGFYSREGEIDPTSNDGYTFKEECISVAINVLRVEYYGDLTSEFLSQYFNISQEKPFINSDYKKFKCIDGGESTIKIIYEFEKNKLTVQELQRGNIFDGHINTKNQFLYLFDKFFRLQLAG